MQSASTYCIHAYQNCLREKKLAGKRFQLNSLPNMIQNGQFKTFKIFQPINEAKHSKHSKRAIFTFISPFRMSCHDAKALANPFGTYIHIRLFQFSADSTHRPPYTFSTRARGSTETLMQKACWSAIYFEWFKSIYVLARSIFSNPPSYTVIFFLSTILITFGNRLYLVFLCRFLLRHTHIFVHTRRMYAFVHALAHCGFYFISIPFSV